MKIHIIIFCCLCRGFDSVTVRSPSGKEYKDSLKDIRLVTGHTTASFQKPIVITDQNEYSKSTRSPEAKVTRQILRKSEEKKKVPEARFDDSQSDSQAQMQKIANQLYLAQKRASLLSDYQKFILSQDVNVKNYVLGSSVQSRSPKPFSPRKPHGRSLTPKAKYVTVKPTAAESISLGKIVVVTPKSQTAVEKISKPQNDHKTQGSHIKYVTLAPQFVESHEPGRKVTLLPYHTPQPHAYYDLGATSKPQVETVQIPATAPFGSYKAPQLHYHHDENEHELKGNYENSKYEFMYKVKDHAKNSHFGHKESRSDKTTYGYYFVQLPDGRLETVRYWADKTGYHAKVDYQGEAKHPTHGETKLNSYNFVYH